MAVSTKHFTLNGAVYQDISEGNEFCSFRIRYEAQKVNTIRIVLGISLPNAETADFDRWDAPEERGTEVYAHFKALAATDRVYARADRAGGIADITAYRK